MNVFVLNINPSQCAIEHDDVRVNKMCVEYTQLLSTVTGIGYKPVPMNPDCVEWVNDSIIHQGWLICLTYNLFQVYRVRRGNDHASYETFKQIINMIPMYADILNNYIYDGIYPLPEYWYYGVPEDCIIDNDIETSYQWCFNRYKQFDKKGKYIIKWSVHPTPKWFISAI